MPTQRTPRLAGSRTLVAVAAAGFTILSACQQAPAGPTVLLDAPVWHTVVMQPPTPPEGLLRQEADIAGPHTLFVNFDGVSLTASNFDDSTRDISAIPTGNTTIPRFDNDGEFGNRAAAIADVMADLTEFFAAYDVALVTTRPPSGTYMMAVVGGTAASVGIGGGGVAGVALLDCGNQVENNVVFAFSEGIGSTRAVAITVAQEAAHAYGLGHTDNNQDLMFPQLSSTQRAFLGGNDIDGSFCVAGAFQDSNQLMLDVLGAAGSTDPTDASPPFVSITFPPDGSTVPELFDVIVDASDDKGVLKVEAGLADGQLQDVDAEAPFQFSADFSGADGQSFTIRVLATDINRKQSEDTITVTVQAGAPLPPMPECTTADQCAAGELCDAGQCVAEGGGGGGGGGTPGAVGARCEAGADCDSGICATDGGSGDKFCTAICVPDDAAGCPVGFGCVDAGGTNVCAPNGGDAGDSTGGCATAPPASGGPGGASLLAGLAVGLALMGGRRRRR